MKFEELSKAIANVPEMVRQKLVEQGFYKYMGLTLTWEDFHIPHNSFITSLMTMTGDSREECESSLKEAIREMIE